MARLILLIAALGALLWLAGCDQPSGGGTWQDRPPSRFQGDAVAGVVFTTEGGVQRMCPQVNYAVGCTVGSTIYVPNPCRWRDPYATLLCHEIGHVNSWPSNHPD